MYVAAQTWQISFNKDNNWEVKTVLIMEWVYDILNHINFNEWHKSMKILAKQRIVSV